MYSIVKDEWTHTYRIVKVEVTIIEHGFIDMTEAAVRCAELEIDLLSKEIGLPYDTEDDGDE